MKCLNEVKIMGNLTRDPELKSTKGGTSVCTFSIATNRQWKNNDGEKQEEVEFHNCVAWEKIGEIIAEYCTKGQPLYVSGYLKTNTWKDKDTDKNMYRTEIVVRDMILLGDGGKGGGKNGRDDDRSNRRRDDDEDEGGKRSRDF